MQKWEIRWIICALVFFATTVNYLDRQVISLLKPFWRKNLTVRNRLFKYSYCFSDSLCGGYLGFGRIIDKLAQAGLCIVLNIMEFVFYCHAFAKTTLVLYCQSRTGWVRGNWPALLNNCRMVPKRNVPCNGIFNSGANIGAIIAPVVVPGLRLLGLAGSFYYYRSNWLTLVGFWFIFYEIPEKQRRLMKPEFDIFIAIWKKFCWKGGINQLEKITWIQANMAFMIGNLWQIQSGGSSFLVAFFPSDEYGNDSTQVSLPLALVYTMSVLEVSEVVGFPGFWSKRMAVYKHEKPRCLFCSLCYPGVAAQALAGLIHGWQL